MLSILSKILAYVIYGTIVVLSPIAKIRIGLLHFQRLGHLAVNTEAFIRRRQLYGDDGAYYIFATQAPANRQLLKMYKRHLNIIESRLLTSLFFRIKPTLQNTPVWEPISWNKVPDDRYVLMNNTTASLRFTPEEEEIGRRKLASMGVGDNDWYVCFHAREANYFRKWRPQYEAHWQSRDFKNCSIDNYIKAAEYITSLGGFAIRMGALVDTPLPETGNPRIIDYAAKYRDDFMDVYLSAKCRFFLASSSGMNMLPMIFEVPVALANNFIPSMGFYHSYDLMTLRLIRSKRDGRIVPYPEALKEGFFAASTGQSSSDKMELFEHVENTPDEIVDLTKDMFDRLNGVPPSPEAAALQKRYADEYLKHLNGYELASPISPRFVMRHRNLLFPEDAIAKPASDA